MCPASSTSASPLTSERQGAIACLTLNQPERHNSLTARMVEALAEQFTRLEADDSVSVIIVQATGASFCAGHDFDEFVARESAASQRAACLDCNDMMLMLSSSSKATIAAVNGKVVGAGIELVAGCDLALASSRASFSAPGITSGLWDHTAQVALSRQIPRRAAMEMLLTGAEFDATEAHRLGLINRVIPANDFAKTVDDLAQAIAEKSPYCIRLGKYSYDHQAAMARDEAYEFVSDQYFRDVQSADAIEGINAKLEGRAAKWHGR